MIKQEKDLGKRARKLWDRREFSALEILRQQPGVAANSDALFFVGLALNALNKRREAIECWRKAAEIDPQNENAIRTLAYELMEQSPVEATELLSQLLGSRRATAEDYTCLGEIRIKQDRLGEARRWLEQALQLEPDNSLALLAMATLYAQVRDPVLTLDYLQKTADTEDVDLSTLGSAPEFEILWHNPTFERIVSSKR